MSEQTLVHSCWAVPCSLGRTVGMCGICNRQESALPKCMCAPGFGAPSLSPLMLPTACRSESSCCNAHAVLLVGRLGGSSDSCGVLDDDGQHHGSVIGSSRKALSGGRDGARAPQIGPNAPSRDHTVGSRSRYVCNYSSLMSLSTFQTSSFS